jgi:hypothetical protein
LSFRQAAHRRRSRGAQTVIEMADDEAGDNRMDELMQKGDRMRPRNTDKIQ